MLGKPVSKRDSAISQIINNDSAAKPPVWLRRFRMERLGELDGPMSLRKVRAVGFGIYEQTMGKMATR